MTTNDPMTIYDVIIIGSGPAGLTAGLYTSRANLKTLLIAGEKWGGQLMLTTLVENYPGFPEGIQGPELMRRMRLQAEKHGINFLPADVTGIDFSKRPFVVSVGQQVYQGRSIILSTGAQSKWLGLESERRLIGRGVSSCASCDAPFFKDKRVVVVGGGDAAMEETLMLAKFASQVTLIHRRDQFRASKIMQERVLSNPKIKVLWNTQVTEVLGDSKVIGVQLMTTNDNRMTTYDCDGVFVAIGYTPATQLFSAQISIDEKGYVVSRRHELHEKPEQTGLPLHHKYHTMTSVGGVFSAGDVHDYHYRQVVTAAGYGCEAALEVERWLSEKDESLPHTHS